MNIKVLVITHGNFGVELRSTVEDIMGKHEDLDVFQVLRCSPIEQVRSDFKDLVEEELKKNKLLVLTDMLGGTPNNIALPYLSKDNVAIVSGVSMPMLITALNKKNSVNTVDELAEIVSQAGQRSVVDCGARVDR
jgi:mannose/fructose-specific phosphotransferase system component IIA